MYLNLFDLNSVVLFELVIFTNECIYNTPFLSRYY